MAEGGEHGAAERTQAALRTAIDNAQFALMEADGISHGEAVARVVAIVLSRPVPQRYVEPAPPSPLKRPAAATDWRKTTKRVKRKDRCQDPDCRKRHDDSTTDVKRCGDPAKGDKYGKACGRMLCKRHYTAAHWAAAELGLMRSATGKSSKRDGEAAEGKRAGQAGYYSAYRRCVVCSSAKASNDAFASLDDPERGG